MHLAAQVCGKCARCFPLVASQGRQLLLEASDMSAHGALAARQRDATGKNVPRWEAPQTFAESGRFRSSAIPRYAPTRQHRRRLGTDEVFFGHRSVLGGFGEAGSLFARVGLGDDVADALLVEALVPVVAFEVFKV